MLWVPGLADLLECIDQSVLTVRLRCDVEVNCSTIRRVAQGDPIVWNVNPLVLYKHFTPR